MPPDKEAFASLMKKMNVYHNLAELGVGITYTSELDTFLIDNASLYDIIEVEPQTLWIKNYLNKYAYYLPDETLNHLLKLPGKKLVHSVGMPVGGNKSPEDEQLLLVKKMIKDLKSPWTSDHMGFNATHEFQLGFFLPQKQTAEGVKVAVNNISKIQKNVNVPFALETGVNYLRIRNDEMNDGEFVAQIVEEADCGILLDLHNIYTNELNGRQKINSFLGEIPLERVLEVHLAGGIEMDGFWLDAHSGAIPNTLIEIAKDIIPHLPNLKAIIFEIMPSYIPLVGLNTITNQLEIIRTIWEHRKKTTGTRIKLNSLNPSIKINNSNISTKDWEKVFGELAIGKKIEQSDIAFELKDDQGLTLLNKLINEFRGSMLVGVFRLTCRFLMLVLGIDPFLVILRDFWIHNTPRLFASEEALNFSAYLKSKDFAIPNLYKLLEYEESVLLTMLDNEKRTISFDVDPIPMIRALADGKLPGEKRQEGDFEIEILPEDLVVTNV